MPFKLEVIRGSTTYDISAGQPIAIEHLDDVGGAAVRVIEEQGPQQDGASHLDYRLEPRTMMLRLNVVGSSASALDGYRDTLNAMFKPVRGVPILLRLTRDDGSIRQLDCERVGRLSIALDKTERPGNLHRAVVPLRAANPLFYDPTEEELSFASASANWWLGYNTIGSANVLEHVDTPTQGQLWTNTGSVAAGSAWTIVFRGAPPSGSGFVYNAISPGHTSTDYFRYYQSTPGVEVVQWGSAFAGTVNLMGGTQTYFVIVEPDFGIPGTVLVQIWRNENQMLGELPAASALAPIPAAGSGTARWRSRADGTANAPWGTVITRAAVYNIALTTTQRTALLQSITAGAGSAFTVSVPYEGDYDSYPVITITGPLTNPVITNTTSGDTLDFTGGTVDTGDIWTIDTRYGRKRAVNLAGSSIMRYLSDDSDLATFRLLAEPLATGGTNVVAVSYGSAGTAAGINIAYYNRYIGF